jgi:moderate conductance mechanosensitive channel
VPAVTLDDLSRWARSSALEIVLIVVGALLLSRLVRMVLEHAPGRFGGSDRHSRAIAQALGWLADALITVIVSVIVLQRLNVPLTSFVAPATIAGVAIGFGAQRIVADLLSGFFLFAERQMGYGDVVRISQPGQTVGVTGTVEALTLRTTRLRTLSGEVVFVPNGEIRQLTNLSMDWARVVLDVPFAAEADLELGIAALRVAAQAMRDDPQWEDSMLGEPAVRGVETLDVDNVTVRLLVRTPPGRQFEVAGELRRRIAEALRQGGMTTAGPVVPAPVSEEADA